MVAAQATDEVAAEGQGDTGWAAAITEAATAEAATAEAAAGAAAAAAGDSLLGVLAVAAMTALVGVLGGRVLTYRVMVRCSSSVACAKVAAEIAAAA